jgi:hypothetical protein
MTEDLVLDNLHLHRFDPNLVWEHYTTLEDEFIRYSRYVPFEKDHYEVWSPLLGDLLNNTGSIIDSFLKNAIYSESLDESKDIEIYRKSKKHNMDFYRTIYENFYQISRKTIFDLKTNESITPFLKWSEGKAPDWWHCYTDLKHDRFTNKKKATLKVARDALGGLFLLNIAHVETRAILIRDKLIFSSNSPSGIRIISALGNEPFSDERQRWAKTRLFGYVFELKGRQIADYEKKALLSPWFS